MTDRCDITYELGHEGNHEIEETNGLNESETENGVREELASKRGVAGNTADERGEDKTDTNTGTSQANGSRAHTKVPRHLNHGLGDLRRVGAAGIEVGEGLASGGVDGRGSLLALDSLEGAVEASDGALGGDRGELGASNGPGDLGGGHEPGGEASGRHVDDCGDGVFYTGRLLRIQARNTHADGGLGNGG
jgi:hypothetical protein